MKIEKYKKLANNKYKIYFEDGETLTTYDDVIINNNLLYKKDIDVDMYDTILEQNKYYDLYNKCLKMISSKMRSVGEIEKYLTKEETSKKDINSIIEKLSKMNLLNDKNYAKAYVSDKMNFTNTGPYKIRKELEDLMIDSDIIEELLSKIDEDVVKNKIEKYIAKKERSNKHSKYMFKEKMMSELLNLGYDKNMIADALDNINIDGNISSEYKKIYNKLSSKYEGDMLEKQIRNKLYQRGYNSEEINEIIKKVD